MCEMYTLSYRSKEDTLSYIRDKLPRFGVDC